MPVANNDLRFSMELAMAGFDELAYRHKAQPVDRSVYARLVRPKLSTTLAAASNMQGAPAIDAFHHFWNGTVNLTVNEQDSSGPTSGTLKVAVIYATLPDNDSKEMRFGVLFRLEKAATMPTVSTQMQPGAGPLRAFTQRITEALETRLAHWAYREYAAGRFETVTALHLAVTETGKRRLSAELVADGSS